MFRFGFSKKKHDWRKWLVWLVSDLTLLDTIQSCLFGMKTGIRLELDFVFTIDLFIQEQCAAEGVAQLC